MNIDLHIYYTASSPLRRLSTYLKNAVTLEDTHQATRRECFISDHVGRQQEHLRRISLVSSKDFEDEQALQARRRESVAGFWARHGSLDESGSRRQSLIDYEGEIERRRSLSGSTMAGSVSGRSGGKWRRLSWGGKVEE